MRFLPLQIVAVGATLFLAACQFGVHITGSVTDALSQRAIPNATVRLAYYETNTTRSGCFSFDGTYTAPFEVGVSAPGYQSVVVKVVPGAFQATVTLVPDGTAGKSTFESREISEKKYEELSRRCAS